MAGWGCCILNKKTVKLQSHKKAVSKGKTAATNSSFPIVDANISVVPNGAHKLGITSLDKNGARSIDNKVDFTGSTLVSNTYQ